MTSARPPKPMSKAALEAAALAYLARFATSSANLKRILGAKVMRASRHYGDDPAPLLAEIESILARYVQKGVLDDAAYAEMQIVKLRRRGGSARAIKERLAAKGVGLDMMATALGGAESVAADRAAAITLARRRRLGPFRVANRAENRQRDLAALGRAGFDYQTAAAVIDAADSVALEGILGGTD